MALKLETLQFITQMNAGIFDEDINFISESVAARLDDLNPLEKARKAAESFVLTDFKTGSFATVKPGSVRPRYLVGAKVEIVSSATRSGRIPAKILSCPNSIPSNGRFKIGNTVHFLVSQLVPA